MVEYDSMCQGICANLDVFANDGTHSTSDVRKLNKLCSQVFCDGNSSYPFCTSLTNSHTSNTSDIIKKITTVVVLVILFLVLVFLMLKQVNSI